MTGRLVQLRLETHRAALVHEEFGAAAHVFAMTAIRRDTREAKEVEEFGELWAHGEEALRAVKGGKVKGKRFWINAYSYSPCAQDHPILSRSRR
jgi:hypothetical protein